MGANNFHLKEGAMKGAKQCALPMHQADCRKRVSEEIRLDLVRLLAELLLQTLKSERAKQGGALWKR
jgi:hypothetical protein